MGGLHRGNAMLLHHPMPRRSCQQGCASPETAARDSRPGPLAPVAPEVEFYVQAAPKSSCSTAQAGHGFICAMNMHDRQHELGPILAKIAMIAEEVNLLAL